MWYNAEVRQDDGIGLVKGSKVLVREAKISHTSIGPTWWVFDGKRLRQVAESYGGHRLYKLVSIRKVFSDQARADKKASPFLDRYWAHRNMPRTGPKPSQGRVKSGIRISPTNSLQNPSKTAKNPQI